MRCLGAQQIRVRSSSTAVVCPSFRSRPPIFNRFPFPFPFPPTSTGPSPRGTGRQDSIASSGLQSAIHISPRIMNPVVAVADVQTVPQHTPGRIRALNVREWRDCMASTITLWWGGEVVCRERRFEMRTAHDPRPPASFLYALSSSNSRRQPSSIPQIGSPVQSRLEPFLVSWSTSSVLCKTPVGHVDGGWRFDSRRF